MPSQRAQTWFRIVVVAAIVAAFGQVTLGGVVRVTDSGLGCPDWPLCHGKLIPPFDTATLIEYSHRLSASVLTLFVAAAALIVWIHYRRNRVVLNASVAAVALVVIAALLGGVTVLSELEWWVVLVHLGLAEILIATLIVAALGGWDPGRSDREVDSSGSTRLWVISALIATFIIILSGSYMVGYGAGTSCGTWPLCRGEFFPDGTAYLVHMAHRYIVAAAGVLILTAAWRVWALPTATSQLRFASGAVAATFAAQVVLGAVVIWSGFNIDLKAAHLSIATVLWAALVWMAALIYLPQLTTDSVETVPITRATLTPVSE